MSNDKFITIRPNTELHPKSKKHPFTDKNGASHVSVAMAFVAVTKGFVSKLTLNHAVEILAKILFSQFTQHPEEFGGILRSTVGSNFKLDQKKVNFLPNINNYGTTNIFCSALSRARTWFINLTDGEKFQTSRGPVPVGAQPCLKCGGSGDVGGSGYHLAVCDPKYPGGWKYIGPCFDCLPKGSQEGRGLGHITRSMARRNLNYYNNNSERWDDNHVGIQNNNLWNPDDNSLWHKRMDQVKMKEVVLDNEVEVLNDVDLPL